LFFSIAASSSPARRSARAYESWWLIESGVIAKVAEFAKTRAAITIRESQSIEMMMVVTNTTESGSRRYRSIESFILQDSRFGYGG
jgi:spore germination protein YaaH